MKQIHNTAAILNHPVLRFVVCSICGKYLSRSRIGIKSHFGGHIRRSQATVADRENFLKENNIWHSR